MKIKDDDIFNAIYYSVGGPTKLIAKQCAMSEEEFAKIHGPSTEEIRTTFIDMLNIGDISCDLFIGKLKDMESRGLVMSSIKDDNCISWWIVGLLGDIRTDACD